MQTVQSSEMLCKSEKGKGFTTVSRFSKNMVELHTEKKNFKKYQIAFFQMQAGRHAFIPKNTSWMRKN